MAIRRISRSQFESYNLARGPVMAPVTEYAWFADDARKRIGTVFLDHTDTDWNYVVMAPDAKGAYRWIGGGGSLDTQEEAEQALITEMSKS
jgi:hypothetical protein